MNNILEQINTLVFPIQVQALALETSTDPVSRLLSSLYSSRGIEIDIRSKDDISIDDFISTKKKNSLTINIDEDLKLFSKPNKIPNFLNNTRQPGFPTKEQKAILSKLRRVPIYTVVNGYNEIVIASPRNMPPKNSLEWFYDKYYDAFLWQEDKGAVSLALFFLNKEDAETYLQEVCKKDPRGAEDIGLSVKIVGLDTFYELNRTSKPRMQAKLIADLEEIDILLNENFTNSFINFHPKQKYRKQWFQGIPIYLIRVNENISNLDKKNFVLSKSYLVSSPINDKKLIFFKKSDVDRVWEFYKLKNKDLRLSEKPILEIYNLENYLLDLEKSNINLTERTTFVPPYESYSHSKGLADNFKIEKDIEFKDSFNKYINSKIKSLQRFYKGLIWLVTSDTLPSEDNSW